VKRLEGKVALITGAGTGIGRGIAQLFAAEGAKIVIAARREDPLRGTVALAPDAISYVQMDLMSRTDRHRAVDTVLQRHGRLDVLVNNAGNQINKAFAEQTEDEIDEVIRTNVISTAQLIHRALAALRQTRGNVVNISSTAGRFIPMPSAGITTYSTSRGGMNMMTRSLATELGPMGVRINAVAPGLTYGEVSGATLLSDPARLASLEALTPLGRIGQPADIARAVLYLASDEAEWITGQILDSSGGWWIGGG
jgi:NAD(P)-dependent dehydrogenase (short-subunit alcohol dehydrogenase family)